MIMKKLIFTFCITILCGFCFCSVQAFADDTLEIYRLYEYDLDLLLSSGCDFYSLGGVGSDKYEYDEAVNIDGAFIIADELINYVYSEAQIAKAVSDRNPEATIKEYKPFTVYTQSDFGFPYLVWIDTSDGFYIAASYLDENYDYAYNLLTPEEAKSQFSEKDAAVYINGVEARMDHAAIRYNGALISLRSVAESLGLTVDWIDDENAAVITSGNETLKIIINPDDTLQAYDMSGDKKYFITGNSLANEPCVWKDDRIVLDRTRISSILRFFYGDRVEIELDSANARINISIV